MNLHVDSEVGALRQAILHRPGLELMRLTPTNKDAYLFDDVLWVKRAKQEHDAFAEVLRDQGVVVHLLDRLLAETMEIPEARRHVLDLTFDERTYGPLAADALAGHVPFAMATTALLSTHVKSGALIPIAVSSAQRDPAYPEVPTIAEQGLPGFEAAAWWGVFAPAGTPADIISRRSEEHTSELQSH